MVISGSSFDYGKLLQEAQIRWLKPSEVYFILKNHERYPIEPETPEKPPSGSLFLFNRRIHRFFRKDGHMWRKKKNGRAVGEAHERLKVGNIDALNCYYAHGELNPSFQRRSYWMLDRSCDHIVLVHYREVSEGSSLPPLSQQAKEQLPSLSVSFNVNNSQFQGLHSGFGEAYDSYQCSESSLSGEVNSKYFGKKLDANCLNMINISENSDLSLQSEVDHALLKLAEQLSLDKCDNKFEDLLPANTNEYEKHENLAFLDNENGSSFHEFQESLIPERECSACDQGVYGNQNSQSLGFHCRISRKISPSWNDMLELSSSSTVINADVRASDLMAVSSVPEPSLYSCNATITDHCGGSELKHKSNFQQFSSEEEGIFGVPIDWLEQCSLRQPNHSEKNEESVLCSAAGTINAESNSEVVTTRKESHIEWTGSLELRLEENAYSSDLLGMWFDQGQHGTSFATEPSLTVAQKQLFRINEISPEWSFSFEKTKVLLVGNFLCNPSSYAWAVMFGDVEVPAEIVQQGVLRCEAPEHTSGRVTLCITSKNRQPCSEVRQFEFRTNPATNSMKTLQHVNSIENSEELLLLIKLLRVLLCQHHDSSVSKGDGQTEAEYHRKFKAAEEKWLQIIDQLQAGCEISSGTMDWVLLELIKDKFQQWQLFKLSSKEDGNVPLSKEEQEIIHLISGLGYEWALNLLLDIGVGVNFRDLKGWTALHWAARFGRY
ncbi:calmodulin-binding transcription activator 4-like [Phalaenopsis equestris]|uniref:calmodulin-binding transcription activator 4-like n=1 Tax=Phalaenopsis equestris TaxID=78828 RepID=UPI0009E237B2|nr:calmodulin-binding transcription activator 4-like [Phalaenopsis equestris]